MLVPRNNQATGHKEVLYWDNGREMIRVPDGEEVKYYKKELARVNAANVYQLAMDLQKIDDQKADIEMLKAALILTDNSLENALKRIQGLLT